MCIESLVRVMRVAAYSVFMGPRGVCSESTRLQPMLPASEYRLHRHESNELEWLGYKDARIYPESILP